MSVCVKHTRDTFFTKKSPCVCVCVAMWAVEYEYVDNMPNKRPRSLCNNPAQSDTQASEVVNAMLELTNEVRQLCNVMAAENNEKRSRSHVVWQQQPVGVWKCELAARYAAQLANVQNEVKRILAANDARREESDRLYNQWGSAVLGHLLDEGCMGITSDDTESSSGTTPQINNSLLMMLLMKLDTMR